MNTTNEYKYKKLNYLYEVIDSFTAGIVLIGPEVKGLTFHGGDINSSYCKFNNNIFKLINTKITLLDLHKFSGYKDNKYRLLLLNKSELKKIKSLLEIKGYTAIPSKLYRNKQGLWKVDIAIVKPIKKYDKREQIKQRDLSRTQE